MTGTRLVGVMPLAALFQAVLAGLCGWQSRRVSRAGNFRRFGGAVMPDSSTLPAENTLRIEWSGVFVVCVTPFTKSGELDEPETRRLVEALIAEGADGIVLAGSTGEWFSMSLTERIRLFEIAADQNAERVVLLAGVSAIETQVCVALTQAAKELGLQGALVLPPPYVLPTERELFAFLNAINAVGLPLMLYNNPARTGVNINASLLARLLPMRSIVALKDSVKDLHQASATLRAHRSELAIFTGLETYLGSVLPRGAAGVVAMAPNVMGASAISLLADLKAGNSDAARSTQDRIDRLYEAMYEWNSNPYVVLKECMRMLGRPGGYPRPPLLSLAETERDRLRNLLPRICGR